MRLRTLLATVLILELAIPPAPARASEQDGATPRATRGSDVTNGAASGGFDAVANSSSGAAEIRYPIDVAPGTNGLQPPITLRYSSASRENGWVGKGWSLELGSIRRSLKRGVPSYTDADTFVLDGEELVPDRNEPGRYHTRRKSFARIRRMDGTDSATPTWLVEQPDGTALRYGTSAETRIDGVAQPFAWLLAEVDDPDGNAIVYRYDNTETGQRFPSEIRYTLRRAKDGALSSLGDAPANDRIIRFTREFVVRPDPRVDHAGGFERRTPRRLAQIDVLVPGTNGAPVILRRYSLKYGQSWDNNASLLTSIEKRGLTGLPSLTPEVTRFEYSTNSPAACGLLGNAPCGPLFAKVTDGRYSVPLGVSFTSPQRFDGGLRIADVNGDGRPDLVRALYDQDVAPDGLNGAYLNQVDGRFMRFDYPLPRVNVRRGARPGAFAVVGGGGSRQDGLVLQDFTGDGVLDLLQAMDYTRGFDECLPEGNKVVPRPTGPRSFFAGTPSTSAGALSGFAASVVAPIGRFAFGLGSAAQEEGSSEASRTVSRGSVILELNGDGLPDLLQHEELDLGVVMDPSDITLLNAGGGRFTVSSGASPCAAAGFEACKNVRVAAACTTGISETAIGGEPQGNRYYDVNGDGLDDFVRAFATTPAEPPRVVLNRGGYFESAMQSDTSTSEFALPDGVSFDEEADVGTKLRRYVDRGIRMFDINGDGIQDIVRASNLANGQKAFQTWLGTQIPGNGTAYVESSARFAVPAAMTFVFEDVPQTDRSVRPMDLDGDGVTDLIRLDGPDRIREAWLNQAVVPDELTKVTSPLGGTQSFTYRASSELDCNAGLDRPVQTVATITSNDRFGLAPVLTQLEYCGGVMDHADREFRGFATVTATNGLGVRTVTEVHTDLVLQGRPSARRVEAPDGRMMERETFLYRGEPGVPSAPFPVELVHRTSESLGDPSQPGYDASQSLRSDVSLSYDDYGNVTSVLAEAGASHGVDAPPARRQTLEYTDPNLESPYITNRVASIKLTSPDGSRILEQTDSFYDEHTALRDAPTRGHLTRSVQRALMAGSADLAVDFDYDAYGHLTQRSDPGPQLTTIEYAPHGLYTFPTRINVQVNGDTTLTTDVDYTLASCPMPLPVAAGLPHQVTDPNQKVTVRCYDERARPTLAMLPATPPALAPVTRFSYTDFVDTAHPASATAEQQNDAGKWVRHTTRLDGFGRPVASVSDGPGGIQVETFIVRDGLGRVAASYLPEDQTTPLERRRVETRFAYDQLNRVRQVTALGGRTTTLVEVRGRTSVTDPNQNLREEIADGFGDLRRVLEYPRGPSAASAATDYDYDHTGRLLRIDPPAPQAGEPTVPATVISYNPLGQRTRLVDPDAGTLTSTYGPAGNLASETDARGKTTYFEYDAGNRLLQSGTQRDARDKLVADHVLRYDEGGAAENALGTLTSVRDAAGLHRFLHDPLGRVTDETHDVAGKRFHFAQTYTRLGALQTRSFPNGSDGAPIARIEARYDDQGYVQQIREAVSGSVLADTFTYDAESRVRSFQTGNGLRTAVDFNADTDLLERLALSRPGQASAALQSLRYDLDPGARVRSIQDELDATRSRSFDYDPLDRLISSDGPWLPGYARGTLRFGYDTYGNLTSKESSTRTYGGDHVPPHAIGKLDGTALTYDASGNLRTAGTREYVWNDRGQLQQVLESGAAQASYVYDQSGRRASATEGGHTRWLVTDDLDWDGTRATMYVTGPSGRLASFTRDYQPPAASALPPLAWLDRSLPPSAALGAVTLLPLLLLLGLSLTSPRRGRLQPALATATLAAFWLSLSLPTLAEAMAAAPAQALSELRYYHSDQLGSTTLQTDATGNVVSRALYKPFGEPVDASSALPTFAFTGQRYEASVKLYDYGARFYDPALGRFLSPDPLADLNDPQTHNPYSYVRNSPLNLIDPTGLAPEALTPEKRTQADGPPDPDGNRDLELCTVGSPGCDGPIGLRSDGELAAEGIETTTTSEKLPVSFPVSLVIGDFVSDLSRQLSENPTGFAIGAAKLAVATFVPFGNTALAVADLATGQGTLGGVLKTAAIDGALALAGAGAAYLLAKGAAKGLQLVRSSLAARAARAAARDLAAARGIATASAKELNQIAHVFTRAEKGLAGLVQSSGASELNALRSVQAAADQALRDGRLVAGPNGILPGNGLGAVLDVNGVRVQLIGGRIVNGAVELGSFVGL